MQVKALNEKTELLLNLQQFHPQEYIWGPDRIHLGVAVHLSTRTYYILVGQVSEILQTEFHSK